MCKLGATVQSRSARTSRKKRGPLVHDCVAASIKRNIEKSSQFNTFCITLLSSLKPSSFFDFGWFCGVGHTANTIKIFYLRFSRCFLHSTSTTRTGVIRFLGHRAVLWIAISALETTMVQKTSTTANIKQTIVALTTVPHCTWLNFALHLVQTSFDLIPRVQLLSRCATVFIRNTIIIIITIQCCFKFIIHAINCFILIVNTINCFIKFTRFGRVTHCWMLSEIEFFSQLFRSNTKLFRGKNSKFSAERNMATFMCEHVAAACVPAALFFLVSSGAFASLNLTLCVNGNM
jgi:hypothetical protein